MDKFLSIDACTLCPRMCKVNRHEKAGTYCRAGDNLKIARAALHMWEEPPISGERGSGAIFFSHCSLKCVYCQNKDISSGGFGKVISSERLYDILFELKEQGAHNINLVSPTHYYNFIVPVILRAKKNGLDLPVIYNGSGYERVEVLRELSEIFDIWLSDYKYASPQLAQKFSSARDYPVVALCALKEMKEQIDRKGGMAFDQDGILQQGMIVRHLILPGHIDQSKAALDILSKEFGSNIKLSLMSQYTPYKVNTTFAPELSRSLTIEEYEEVLDYADELKMDYYWQEGEACSESFIPPFDMSGV